MQYLRFVTYLVLLICVWLSANGRHFIPATVWPPPGIDDSWLFSLERRTGSEDEFRAASLSPNEALRIAEEESIRRGWHFGDKRVGMVSLSKRAGRLVWTVQMYDAGSTAFEVTIDDESGEPRQNRPNRPSQPTIVSAPR